MSSSSPDEIARDERGWLLIDVDGTLVPGPARPDPAEHLIDEVGAWLSAAASHVNLAWYTGWEEMAVPWGRRLGVGDLPWVPMAFGADQPSQLKAAGLLAWEHFDPQRRYAILDDDIPPAWQGMDNVRFFEVDAGMGLRPETLMEAVQWAAGGPIEGVERLDFESWLRRCAAR